MVVAEFSWVLQTAYRLPKDIVLGLLERLMSSEDVTTEQGDVVALAIAAARDGGGDFADLLIALVARSAGAETTMTFDRKAARKISDMTLLA